MMLENKVAVVYGGGGSIGSAAAAGFAREGATVYLAGRTQEKLDKTANAIRAKGGKVETRVLDALDEKAVDAFVDEVVKQAGHIDISFNLISVGDVQQPLNEISVDDFLQPITITMRTQFLTTRAASRHMMKQKSGVILTFGGGGPQTVAGLGGFKISLDATEGLRRQWAVELGEYGIRVVTLKTGGIPESLADTFAPRDEITESITNETLLKRAATLEDVGNVAAFVASDLARTITSTEINISAGALVD
ncbi:MAG: SDR family oxidoreductase [Anaerolineae bacterium]|nr:SDR family oxidoreductase [Anaerolineae bacterium]